eukprot:15435017-Alexandrium_andersonii.AAC.1
MYTHRPSASSDRPTGAASFIAPSRRSSCSVVVVASQPRPARASRCCGTALHTKPASVDSNAAW